MAVKKAYVDIVTLLENAVAENPKVKVADLLDRVREMSSAKVARSEGTTFLKAATGEVVAIYDYYFKRWMPLVGEKAVVFGLKAKSTTGFNTMCKEGVSKWTKQQAEAEKAQLEMLEDLKTGALAVTDIDARKAEIEASRKRIEPTELGFETEEQVREYLANSGVQL